MSTPGLPDYKRPPAAMIADAKAGRARLRVEAHKRGAHTDVRSTLCDLCRGA